MIILTKYSAQVFDYMDTMPDFMLDSKNIGIDFPDMAGVDVIFDDCVTSKYQVSNGTQAGLEKKFQDFIQKIIAALPALNRCKSDREKPPPLTFQQKKEQAYSDANILCSTAREKIAKTSDPNKIGSWATYKTCAERYLDKTLPESEKAMLLDEIKIRNIAGETIDTFVQKIMDNSLRFFKATTYITGVEKRALLDVESSLTDQDLENAILKLTNALNKF